MLANKKSAQTLVFIAFLALITNPTAKSGLKNKTNGVYAFVLKGDFTIHNESIKARDGLGIWDIEKLAIKANSQDAELLLMEVPMSL